MTKLQREIIKYISSNPNTFHAEPNGKTVGFFLFDFSSCVNPAELCLIMELVEKHFNIVNRKAYLGMSEYSYR